MSLFHRQLYKLKAINCIDAADENVPIGENRRGT